MFAVIGNLIFYDVYSYGTISEAMLTMFKASAGDFNKEKLDQIVNSTRGGVGPGWGYTFILTYMLLNFILIVNVIVGQLSSAYKKFHKKRSSLMLMETLSVRDASEADDKYSSSVSPIYPLSILNMFLGTYILSIKN
jgi:hypothetical protein